MNPNINLRQLIYFCETAHAQNFSAAAARLSTSQSNVSATIQNLESAIGARLINRTSKKFELTSIGVDFLETVEDVLKNLKSAVDNVSAAARLERGYLSVGASPLLAAAILPDILQECHKKHPGLKFHLRDITTDNLISLLRSGEIELALGTFDKSLKDIEIKQLLSDKLVLLAHSTLSISGACDWETLSHYPIVSISRESSVGRLINKTAFKLLNLAYFPLIEAENWMTVISLTRALRGVCIVPEYAVDYLNLLADDLLRVELIGPSVSRNISVAFLNTTVLSIGAREFLKISTRKLRSTIIDS